ncbi:7-ethoxycoumarin O-deethylase-like protein [Cinnamomum micranthum f. kanehirae]|uniref:7-ethoxycoumarin O-deethylase-like protein n=1 Tax=Cinnamomum micranthum f. kanehirae TaxID=337451 RepID=A0A3S3MBT9_9MAGN|nr:7-ethoxycoumarin O-deethylase-like protein [Cinnamomum micranthum f. kanehirae]
MWWRNPISLNCTIYQLWSKRCYVCTQPFPSWSHTAPSLTCAVGDYTIPQGARVFVNVWAIHRDPSIWPNPSEFNPDRFLNADREWDFTGNDFNYFPFRSGIAMAERMVMYSVASLVHSFDWRLPEGTKLDLSEKFGIVLKKAEPLIAIPTPRLSNPDLHL